MKSIIQEASSVSKAIEQAWVAAGKPKEFSVKVFEEAEKNFIGMTKKSAKIGIFFEQEMPKPRREAPSRRPRTREAQRPEQRRISRRPTAIEETRPERKTPPPIVEPEPKTPKKKELWTDEMIQEAKRWVEEALRAMEKSNIGYTTDVNNYYLRFSFKKSIAETEQKKRELFRNFSFLMLQALKQKFKRPLRGFKIVLTS